MPPPAEMPPESNAGPIIIACFGVVGAALTVLFTYALFGPGLFIILLLFAAVASLHYWLWGRSFSSTDTGNDGSGSVDSVS